MSIVNEQEIADIIFSVLSNAKPGIVEKTGKPSKAQVFVDEQIIKKAQNRVMELLKKFPLYPEIEIWIYFSITRGVVKK